MVYIPKPQDRESILIFADGSEAVFGYLGNSSNDGYYLVHLRPTNKMRWRYQIQMTEADGFDKYDGWWKKIYKKDLCLELSHDPDFPMWLILCDYDGNENTTLMDYFVRCKQLIERNRHLENENKQYKMLLNRKELIARKKAMHPDESFLEFEEKVKRMIQAGAITPTIIQQPSQEVGTER